MREFDEILVIASHHSDNGLESQSQGPGQSCL